MGDVNLTPGPDQMLQSFLGSPNESVRLCAVQVKVTKNFDATTSDVITVSAPSGYTIIGLHGCTATIYPGTIQAVDVAGTLEIQFNASIFFMVELDDHNVVMLSDTITVQGVLGPTADIKVTAGGIGTPSLACAGAGIDPGGVSVHGQITVGAFSVITCQFKSVKVVLDPDVLNPVDDPIDP